MKLYAYCMWLCVIFCLPAKALDESSFAALADSEGPEYLAARALLLQQTLGPEAAIEPRLQVLHGIIKSRQERSDRVAAIQALMDESYSVRRKLSPEEQQALREGRYLKLSVDLGKMTERTGETLSIAMAEILWKTGRDDYERRCAARVLYLPDVPTVGVYEIARDALRANTTSAALAQDLLELLAKYVLIHGVGVPNELVSDIRVALTRFNDSASLVLFCTNLLKGVGTPAGEKLASEVSAATGKRKAGRKAPEDERDVPVVVDVK